MEEMAGIAARATSPPLGTIPIFHQPEDSEDTTASALAKARRRGSLSISRFGQVVCNQLPLAHRYWCSRTTRSRSQSTPSMSPSVRAAFLGQRPQYRRSFKSPRCMLNHQ